MCSATIDQSGLGPSEFRSTPENGDNTAGLATSFIGGGTDSTP